MNICCLASLPLSKTCDSDSVVKNYRAYNKCKCKQRVASLSRRVASRFAVTSGLLDDSGTPNEVMTRPAPLPYPTQQRCARTTSYISRLPCVGPRSLLSPTLVYSARCSHPRTFFPQFTLLGRMVTKDVVSRSQRRLIPVTCDQSCEWLAGNGGPDKFQQLSDSSGTCR